MQQRKLVHEVCLCIVMVAVSFVCGWLAYGQKFSDSRQVNFDFTKTFWVPKDRESWITQSTPDTALFALGDRIDVFAEIDGDLQPVIVDAVVSAQQKGVFGLLVPRGGFYVMTDASKNRLRLIYRRSIATTEPISLEPYQRKSKKSMDDESSPDDQQGPRTE